MLYVLSLVVVQGEGKRKKARVFVKKQQKQTNKKLLCALFSALIVHRVHRHAMHWLASLVQHALHIAGVVLAALMLVAFVRHSDSGEGRARFATFRSWLDIALIAGFWLQGLVGIAALVFPRARRQIRGVFSPLPRIFSAALVVLSAIVLISTLQAYANEALGL